MRQRRCFVVQTGVAMQVQVDYVSKLFLFRLFTTDPGTCGFTCKQKNPYLDPQGCDSTGTQTRGSSDPRVFPRVYPWVTHGDPHP